MLGSLKHSGAPAVDGAWLQQQVKTTQKLTGWIQNLTCEILWPIISKGSEQMTDKVPSGSEIWQPANPYAPRRVCCLSEAVTTAHKHSIIWMFQNRHLVHPEMLSPYSSTQKDKLQVVRFISRKDRNRPSHQRLIKGQRHVKP